MKSLDGEGGEFNQEGMGIKPLLSQWPGPCVGSGLVDIKAEEMVTHTAFANDGKVSNSNLSHSEIRMGRPGAFGC